MTQKDGEMKIEDFEIGMMIDMGDSWSGPRMREVIGISKLTHEVCLEWRFGSGSGRGWHGMATTGDWKIVRQFLPEPLILAFNALEPYEGMAGLWVERPDAPSHTRYEIAVSTDGRLSWAKGGPS